MRQKALFISIVMTLFVLGIVAGVARAAFTRSDPAPLINNEKTAMEQTLQQREADYSQNIAEANQRIKKANQTIRQMQTRINEQETFIQSIKVSQAQTVPTSGPEPATSLPLEKILSTAEAATQGWVEILAAQPEQVEYQGKNAYEVKLANGGSIYIASSTGEVLYNSLTGSAKNVISPDDAKNAAIAYLKGGGVFRVDASQYNGQPAYRVIFDVGHRIYVGLNGDILYVELYKMIASSGGGGGGGGGGGSRGGEDHGDDHGGGDDD
jgi:TolA-binding protein